MMRSLTCIVCPRGCLMDVQVLGETVTVTGNSCSRGEEYARTETLHPVRTVTTTVKVANRADTMVSVKTEQPIPKESMMEAVTMLRRITVEAPIAQGTVIMENVFGSRVVVTKAAE